MLNLFNSVGNNQNSFFSNMNFADYASIRNGSYNKLLRAYYSQNGSQSSSGQTTASRTKTGEKQYWDYNEKIKNAPKKNYNYWNYSEKIKGQKSPGEKFSNIQNAAANLESSTTSMGKAGDIDYNAASSFVSRYNDLVTAAKDSGSVVINSSMRSIADYTKAHEQALAKIGITMDDKGAMKIDKDTFQSASADTVNALFKGSNSYGAKVGSRASAIQSNARYEAGKYGVTSTDTTGSSSSTGSTTTTGSVTGSSSTSSGQLSVVRSNASDLAATASRLVKGSDTIFKTDADGGYDTSQIYSAVSDFVKQYNATVESAGKSDVYTIRNVALASMTDRTKANSSSLAEIGITIDAAKKTLTLNEEQFKAADPEKVKKLFTGEYGKKINEWAAAISSHANYEINKGGMYNSVGNYSYNNTGAFNVVG